MIKKLLILVLVLGLVLTGCSSPAANEEQTTTATTATTATTVASTTEKALEDSAIISVLETDFAYGLATSALAHYMQLRQCLITIITLLN